MRFSPENIPISELLEAIEEKEIALPEFQRKFLWKPPQVADLLRTVARRWPAGTFLVLDVDGQPSVAFKGIDQAPHPKSPKMLILDGQQRTTALFHALTDRAPETYYVAMGDILSDDEFDDEDLRFAKNARFAKEYPTMKAMVDERIAKVSTIASDREFNKWLKVLDDDVEEDEMLRIREDMLPGLREYDMPTVRLPTDAPLASIAKIFETINRTGLRLATFDLMVARLYPFKFHLRDEWDKARDKYEEFKEFGVDDGVEILKVIALRERLRQQQSGVRVTVKGVRESDVLELEASLVKGDWNAAVTAYVAAIRFVKNECGVIRRALMPSMTMLLPLAEVLAPDRKRRRSYSADLKKWFWATCFMQTYAQGANTQATRDSKELRAWNADESKPPEVLRAFRFDPELLSDGRRRNEMLLRGLLCRMVARDARDWIGDKRFIDIGEKLEFHHIFPDEYLEKHYRGDSDPVANFALLTESTNKKLRNTIPNEVLERPDVSKSAVATADIDPATLKKGTKRPGPYIKQFLEDRSARLLDLIYDAVGVEPPE
jgi:hypothetical protein